MPCWKRCRPFGGDERGQATLEYALVLFAFAATIVALAAIWHAARDGALLRLCRDSLSHSLTSSSGLGFPQDVLLY